MGRIVTALEVQQHNQDRVSVFLDGEFAFGLPIVEAAQLHKGQELDDAEVARLRALDDVARAFDRAVILLARRPYSEAEIRRNLQSKAIAQETIDEALQRLRDYGYVDDRAFAEYWVENRERFRPRGPRALSYELRQKGIPSSIIEVVLQDVDAEDSAYRAAQERAARLRGLDQATFREKLGAFLVRRGFNYDVARDALDQLIRHLEDEDPDHFDNQQPDEE